MRREPTFNAARWSGDTLEIPPSTRLHLRPDEAGQFPGWGAIDIRGISVRAGSLPWRLEGFGLHPRRYRAWVLEKVDLTPDGRGAILRTTLRGEDGTRDRLDWHLRGEEWEIGGRPAVGFSYRFEFRSPTRQLHQLVEHGSWCLGGDVEGVLYLEQAEGYGTGSRGVLLGPETEIARRSPLPAKGTPESRQGVGDFVDVLAAAHVSLVRFVREPALTFKDSFRAPGAAEIETEERYVTPLTSHYLSPWMTVLIYPEGGVDAWFRIRDAVAEHLRRRAGTPWQPPLPWVGISSFDVADWPKDVEGRLDFYQRMGFRRLWKWSLYRTNWSEWDALTEEQREKVGTPLSHAVLALNWASRLPAAQVEELCRKAEDRGLEVILWFPTAHLSPLSPLLQEHPNWIVRRKDGSPFNYVYPDLVGVSHAQGYSEYALDRLRKLRQQAPFHGLFLDSFQVFGSDAIHYGLPEWPPQFPALLDFLRELYREGLTVLAEGHTPYAIPASTGFLQGVQTDPEFLLYKTNPHWGGQKITPERYFRLVAFMAPSLLDEKEWWSNEPLQKLGSYVNRAYNRRLSRMSHCVLLPEDGGTLWWDREEREGTLFAFRSGWVDLGGFEGEVREVLRGTPTEREGTRVKVEAYRVYAWSREGERSEPTMGGEIGLQQTLHTGLRHFGGAVAVVDGNRLLFVTGEQGRAGGRAALLALNPDGSLRWKDDFPEEPGRIAMGAEPHIVDLGDGKIGLAHFVAHRESGAPGIFRLLSPRDGTEFWRAESGTIYGGNRDVTCVDVDGDGDRELLVGYADRLVCYRATDGEVKWARTERMAICWGRSAVADLNGDGRLEIVLGSEYANPDGTSSLYALTSDGSILWEYPGIGGDCGSTPAFLVDMDGDGTLEVVKTEIDLEGRGPVGMARLWCLRADGSLLWRCDFGGGDIAVGDLDGDGFPEAVGLTNGRDGGPGVEPSIRCVDLRNGEFRWQIPLERHWLSGWPVLFDWDGDGLPEAILPQGNPSGYGKQADQDAWGEVYVVKGDGQILHCLQFSDWPLAPLVFDWDGDGSSELLIPCGDGKIYVYGREEG